MSQFQNDTQRENIALINYIINKLETSMFCSFGLLKVGDGYAQFNKAYRNKYNYIGPALPNNIEAFNNQPRYQTFNDFINPEQYTQIPICFLFKKMDLPNFIEIIKNKEDSFYTDLKSHYQTDEINENIISDFYTRYNIYVTPFRFMYCQLKEGRIFEDFNLYFMGTTTTALINQDNLYEHCDSLTRDNERRFLNNVVSDVFVGPYSEQQLELQETNSNRIPATPPRRRGPRRSAPNSNVSSLNSDSPTRIISNFPQFDSPNSNLINSPLQNFSNTTPTTSSSGDRTSRSIFEGGKKKTKKGRNKKTKRKSNKNLKKVGPKGRSPCKK